MSLLDAESELAVRARLPEGVRMLTGDDYNYVDLIGGEALVGVDGVNHAGKGGETLPVFQGHSDALLGAFAALVAPASAALPALDAGEPAEAGDRASTPGDSSDVAFSAARAASRAPAGAGSARA